MSAVVHDFPKERIFQGGGGNMDSRVARLEASVTHIEKDITEIKKDLRLILGAIICAVLGLASLMAKGFKWF